MNMLSLHRKRRGMTIFEILIAGSLVALVGTAVVSALITTRRMYQSITTQQRSLKSGKELIEHVNRHFRYAQTPVIIIDEDDNFADTGIRVEFQELDEDALNEDPPRRVLLRRAYELVSDDDDDFQTPWDNRLVYDPDRNTDGDEVTIARDVSVVPDVLPFTYTDGQSPLVVRLRVGDPVIDEANPNEELEREANFRTGPGLQGFEVNITVAPRN